MKYRQARSGIIGRSADESGDWYDDLVSAIGSRVGDVPGDVDCVQEAVIRYWQQLVDGQAIRSAPAWVKSVARNLARDESRRRHSESRALQRLGSERDMPIGWEAHPYADELRERISRLPQRQREIVVLYYFGDLSVAEVAAEAGCRVGTVKATLHQARRALADALRPEGSTTDSEVKAMSLAHWGITGTHRYEYDIDDTDELLDEHRVAVLRCIVDDPGGFGALVQRFEPGRFAGHRVRFSGMLRAEQVTGWAGLWMRVDGAASPSHKSSLAFYNNEDRGLTGTTSWVAQDAVLDVADEASVILIGAILSGKGSLHIADLHVDIVGLDVEVTRQPLHGATCCPSRQICRFGKRPNLDRLSVTASCHGAAVIPVGDGAGAPDRRCWGTRRCRTEPSMWCAPSCRWYGERTAGRPAAPPRVGRPDG